MGYDGDDWGRGGKFVSWQDDSSQLHLKKKAQPATEASVASLQQMHQTSANQILQGFDDSLSLTNLSSASAAPVVQISSKQAASSARATRRPAPLKDECDAESQRFPVLKCLKGVRDPLIAASKVRKATLTQLGLLESKCSKALDLCREVLGIIQDDYDCEDHDYHLWESVAVLLDQVGSCHVEVNSAIVDYRNFETHTFIYIYVLYIYMCMYLL